MKRIVTIQDLSCLGKCSITVALPVISAMGVECAVLPTAVLSTHTMFQDFVSRDLTDLVAPVSAHWQAQKLHFDAIYTGYLASPAQVDAVCQFFDQFADSDALRFVDPAMADHGKLYHGFSDDFPRHMARVCAYADIIVPNLTEACLLTETPYRTEYDEAFLRALLQKLTGLGAKRAVITGVSNRPGQLGIVAYDAAAKEFSAHFNPKLPLIFHGTGDLFAAACVGGLMRDLPLAQALQLASAFVVECINRTTDHAGAAWYGVEFERAIPWLVSNLEQTRRAAGL